VQEQVSHKQTNKNTHTHTQSANLKIDHFSEAAVNLDISRQIPV